MSWYPKGLAAARKSNNLSLHGDAERQCDQAGIKVWGDSESPQSCPLPDCLLNSPLSLPLFSFALDMALSLTFLKTVLEYTRLFCSLTQAGLPS